MYILKSFCFYVRSLWKPQHHVIYLNFFIKSVVKWSEILWDLIFLWELPSIWAKFCEILSHSVWYGMYAPLFCCFSPFFWPTDYESLTGSRTKPVCPLRDLLLSQNDTLAYLQLMSHKMDFDKLWPICHEVKVIVAYFSWSRDFALYLEKISQSSDLALYLEECLMYKHHIFRLWVSMAWSLTSKYL